MRPAVLLLLVGCGRVAFDPTGDGGPDAVADVMPDQPPPAGGAIDVWYRMNEGTGETLVDDGFADLDAMLTGTFTRTAGAIHFTGAGYATTPLDGSYRNYPLTIMAWVTPDARSDRTANNYSLTPFPPNAVSNDMGGVGGFGVGANVWTDGTPGSSLYVGWVLPAVAGPSFNAGERYHLALTYQTNQNVIIFINGANVASRGTAADDGLTSTLYIGAHNADTGYGTKRFFVGEIDDVRIYRRLLSPQDIADIYDQGPY